MNEPEYLERKAEEYLEKAEQARQRLAIREQYQDIFEEGDVVQFNKDFNPGGTKYTYAAIKVKGRWYISHKSTAYSRGLCSMTWNELLDWIGDRNLDSLWYASEWRKVGD